MVDVQAVIHASTRRIACFSPLGTFRAQFQGQIHVADARYRAFLACFDSNLHTVEMTLWRGAGYDRRSGRPYEAARAYFRCGDVRRQSATHAGDCDNMSDVQLSPAFVAQLKVAAVEFRLFPPVSGCVSLPQRAMDYTAPSLVCVKFA